MKRSAPRGRTSGPADRPGSTPPPAVAERGAARRWLPALALLAAALVLWAGAALGQTTPTSSITHTGSAAVTGGKIQLVEGGASTTFQIDLEDNFVTKLQAAHPETARSGTRFSATLRFYRDSSDVTWTTSGTGFADRTDEFEVSYNGTALRHRYNAAAPTSAYPESRENRLWFYVPLGSGNNGESSSTTNDLTAFEASFPITFTIKAESDTTYFEDESIRVGFSVLVFGSQASPRFTSFGIGLKTLAFDLVDGVLPAPTAKPTTPANLAATAGKGAATLTWDAVDVSSGNTNLVNDVQITKHQVRQSTDGGANYGDWTDIPRSAYGGVNDVGYTIDGLSDGTTYTFQVRAVNACTPNCGNSDPATAVMATPDAAALARPTGLRATAGNTQVTLRWDPGDASITAYEVQQKAGPAAFGAWTEIRDSSAATTSYRLTGLANGTRYSYRIRAKRGATTSLASDAVTTTPQGVPPVMPNLTATPRSGGVTLSWRDPVDASLTRYEYQYKIGTAVYTPWQQAAELDSQNRPRYLNPPHVYTDGTTMQFPVGGLRNGTAYTFRIRAVNANGRTISDEVSVTPVLGVPAKPTGLTTRLSTSRTRLLEWDLGADPSILHYEFTADNGRTWPTLAKGSADRSELPRDQFLSGYTFRIRAVNAVGPGPASDPAVEEGGVVVQTRISASGVTLTWDSITKKATLSWSGTSRTDLRWWQVFFAGHHGHERSGFAPIGTLRYEIPGTYEGGTRISMWIAGCRERGCIHAGDLRLITEHSFVVGAPQVVTGVSAIPGDAQITLTWDDPMDSSITKFQYEMYAPNGNPRSYTDIPDGNDAGSDAGDETSYVVTTINRVYNYTEGAPIANGSTYAFRVRAANVHGSGPWSQRVSATPLLEGVPAVPTGLMRLISGPTSHGRGITSWDDPHDPSITKYQHPVSNRWEDLPGTDATTTRLSQRVDRIRAVNANGVGLQSEQVRHVTSPAPLRPTGLQAVAGHGRVTLTWDDPGEGVYINTYRYTRDSGKTWTEIPGSETTVEGQLTRHVVTGLTNGEPHSFAILAENDVDASPPSAPATATPQAAAPAKPTGLAAAPGNAEATLTWDNPRDPSITGYQVKQGTLAWADIAGSAANTVSHTVTGLANGTAYTFRIRAVNDHNGDTTDDPGPASDAVSVTPGVPTAPAALSVVPGDTQATLTWTAPASNGGSAVLGYEYTSNAAAAAPTWTDVPDSGTDGRADETTYTVTGLTNNTPYAFAVRAENANGQGAATPTRRAVPVPPDAPRQPTGFRAIPGHQWVASRWKLPDPRYPVTAYQYRQSTNGGATWNPDNWATIPGSGADTTEHRFTGLANGTTYTFELRALNGSIVGPAARAQATPSPTAAEEVISPQSFQERGSVRTGRQITTADGSTYTITQLSLPDGLDWRLIVSGTTDIDGRAFTLRGLQGTTPESSSQYKFTSSGQEGLDIVVSPALGGPVQVCLAPSDLLRLEAGSRPLRVLHHDGRRWMALPTTTDGNMLCGTTSSMSAFVLGYAAPTAPPSSGGGGGGGTATNNDPTITQSIPPRSVPAGVTSEPLDLSPYFTDPDGDSLTYAAASNNVSVAITNLERGSSELTLYGVAAGRAVVTVTATDEHGGSADQTFTVTVTGQAAGAAPEVAQRIPPQTVAVGTTAAPMDLTPYFRNPDGDPLTYVAVSYDADVLVAEVAPGSSQLTLRGVAVGDAGVIVTASNPGGGHASQPVAVAVRTAAAMRAAQRIPPPAVVAGAADVSLDLTPYFHAPDGGSLTYAAVSDDPAVLVAEVAAGSRRLTLRGVAAGQAVVTVTASDSEGGSVSRRMLVTVAPPRSAAPEVAQRIPPQAVLIDTTGVSLDLAPYFQDPDGDPLTYAAVSSNGAVLVAEVVEGRSRLTLRAVALGQAAVTVTASDPHGGHASQSVPVMVRTNTAPEVAEPLPPQAVLAGGASAPLDLTPYFHDPDGDPLTYAAVSDNAAVLVAEVADDDGRLTLRGVTVGEAVIVVVASDSFGEHASQFVTVTVRINTVLEALQPIPEQTAVAGAVNDPLDLAPYFLDPDGDPLTYTAASSDGAVVVAEVAEGDDHLTLRGVTAGDAVVIVMASDPFGEHASQFVTVTVRKNAVPQVAQPIPPQTVPIGASGDPLDLASYFHDPDGDPLAYMAASDNPVVLVADVAAGGDQLTLRGITAGQAVVTVMAVDPYGAHATQAVTVTVQASAAPQALQPIPPQTVPVGGAAAPLHLAPYFHDPDGDPLTYTALPLNAAVRVAGAGKALNLAPHVRDAAVLVAEVAPGGNQLTLHGVAAGQAVVVVTARDPHGGVATQTLQVTVQANAVPQALQPIPPQTVPVGAAGDPLDLAPYFHDPDGDPLAYVAVSDNPAVLVAEVATGSDLLTLRGVAAGRAVVMVTAGDPHDGYVTQAVTVTVWANAAPEAAQPIPPQTLLAGAPSEPLDLAPYFHDPDGDPLAYTAISDNPAVLVAEVAAGGSRLTLRGVAAGDAVVTVTARDPYGEHAGQTLAVTVRTNAAPEVAQPIPPQTLLAGAASDPLDLAPYFHDPDGDPLTYAAVSANPEVATAAVTDRLFTLAGVAVGSAAVTVTARDPHDATASQTVTVTVTVADPAWVQAWIARFGRTVSGQVLDGVQERLRLARQPGFEATLAGHRLDGSAADEDLDGDAAAFRRELGALAGWMDEQMDAPTSAAAPGQALTGRDLLTSTAFTLTGGDADSGFAALWGRGAVSHFTGDDGALSLDGEVATGMLGADWVSGRWLAGLTLALSRGTGAYRAANGSGDVESTLTGLYPWLGYHVTDRLSVWTAVGYGAGTLTVTPQDQAAATADMTLALVAAGARSDLLELPQLGGILLALETDTRLTRTSTGATADLEATAASVWQLRLGLEGSRHVALPGGGALRPSIELGLRHDGGDAETGSGIDVGAGLTFTSPASGLSLDLAARGLLAHRASGFREWGASAALAWDPTPSSDQGLSMSLQQSVGAAPSGGVHALLARDTMAAAPEVAGIIDGAGRLQARLGYGLPLGDGRFVGTPQLGFGLSGGRHDVTLGWHLSVARHERLDLTVGVEASRRESPDAANPEHGVMLQFRLGH